MSFWQDLLFPSGPSKQRVVGSNPPRDATIIQFISVLRWGIKSGNSFDTQT